MVDTRIVTKIWSSPLLNVSRHYGTWPQWHPPLIKLCNSWPCYRTGPYDLTDFDIFYQIARCFYRTFATGAACQQKTLAPLDTGPVPFGTCRCSSVETCLSWTWHVTRTSALLVCFRRSITFTCLSGLLESHVELRINHSYEEHVLAYRISCEIKTPI